MSTNSTLFAAFALAIGLAFGPAATPVLAQKAGNGVIANVNGHDITERDVELAETEIGNDLGNLAPETRRRVLVEYVIETQLMANALDKAENTNKSKLDSAKAYFERRAKRETFFETNVKSSISEATAETFFKDRVKSMNPEEEVKARHILVETQDEARDIKEKIARGEKFEDMAKAHSRDPGTKDNGGLLGFFSRGQMVPQFEQAAFTAQPNEVTDPVQSRFGWHLILVEEKRKKPLPKFDEVKDRILNSMIHQKAQAVAQKLRSDAKIEYFDEAIKKQVAEEKLRAAAQQKGFVEQLKKMQDQQNAKPAEKPAEAEKK